MSGNDHEGEDRNESGHNQERGWLSRLDKAEKIIAAISAVVVALGVLGGAAYLTVSNWEKVFGPASAGASAPASSPISPTFSTLPPSPASSGPSNPEPSGSSPAIPSSSPPPSTAASSPTGPGILGSAQISKVTSASGNSCIGDTVKVDIAISNLASADRELWLMAVVMTGTPVHPVYFAKRQLANAAGTQTATVQFIGSAVGSVRNLVIVSAAPGSFNWLKQNLENDGNPQWDVNRVKMPSGVSQISGPYKVKRAC